MPSLKPHYFFLVLALPVALLLTLLIPPFHTPDEHTHFYKALLMAEGHIKARNYSNKTVGYAFPGEYKAAVDKYLYKSATFREILHDVRHRPASQPDTLVSFANTSVYPPIAYLPQTAGIALGRALHLSVISQLYMARMFAALSWIALIFFALRLLPVGKWFAAALSVTPVMLSLAASSSNDAITFGFCLLWLSLVLYFRSKPESIGKWQLLGLTALALVLGLSKPPYGLFALLVFLIPSNSFRWPKITWYAKTGLCLVMLSSLLLWTHYVIDIYIPTSASASTTEQLQHILHHPLQNIGALIGALVLPPASIGLIDQLVNPSTITNAHLPKFLIVVELLALLTILIASVQQSDGTLRTITVKCKIMIIFLLLAMSAGVAELVYLSFDPVAATTITGINARYFMPMLYLFVPLLIGNKDLHAPHKNYSHYQKIGLILSLALVAVAAVLTPLISFMQIYA